MRIPLYLCWLFVLCGCNTLPLPSVLLPRDQQLFVQGMDEVNPEEGLPEAFVTLQRSYPESHWAHRAQTVIDLLETIRTQQKTVIRLKKETYSSRKNNEELRNKIESLEIERQKLRQLLIDLEKRG